MLVHNESRVCVRFFYGFRNENLKIMIETIKKMQNRILEHQKENGFETIFDFLNEDLNELETQVKNLHIPDVVKSLPTDECVEQWWAEGQDQNKNFWNEAPYRTNGDVVEEIKAALKYFIETWQR